MSKIKLLLLLLIPFFVSCVTPITVEPLDYVVKRKELQQKEIDLKQKKEESTTNESSVTILDKVITNLFNARKKLDDEIANLDDLKKTTIICQNAEESLVKLADKKISIWLTVLAALITGGTSFANAEVTLALASMSAGVVAWRGFINTNEEENRKRKKLTQKENIGISPKILALSILTNYGSFF